MKRLKEMRQNRGFKQYEIAELVGVDRTTYSNYENGRRDPDTATVVKLAEILGVSTDYLLGHETKPDIEVWDKELGRYVPVETKTNSTKKEPLSLEEIEALYMQALIDKKIMTPGKPMSPETRQKLEEQIRLAIRIAIESNKGD